MSLSLPSLPSFNFGGNEKLSDTDILPEVINLRVWKYSTLTDNTANSAEASHTAVTYEMPNPTAPEVKPDLNTSPATPRESVYNQTTKHVANGALNGAVYHERLNVEQVNRVRDEFSDVLGGPHAA